MHVNTSTNHLYTEFFRLYVAGQRVKNLTFKFSSDGIHPSLAGHLFMAETLLNAIGIQVDEHDLTRVSARATIDRAALPAGRPEPLSAALQRRAT